MLAAGILAPISGILVVCGAVQFTVESKVNADENVKYYLTTIVCHEITFLSTILFSSNNYPPF
jgi:hypothetical protein